MPDPTKTDKFDRRDTAGGLSHAQPLAAMRKSLAQASSSAAVWAVPGLPAAIKAMAEVLDEVEALRRELLELRAMVTTKVAP